MGDDDVRCRYHLRETLDALLDGNKTDGGVRRRVESPPPSDRLQAYLLQIQLVKPLHVQWKEIWVGFPQLIVDDIGIQP